MPRILVIGSTNTDMVLNVTHLPQKGETVANGSFFSTPGGKGANQAVAAVRLGGAVTFVAAVGDDSFGGESRQRLANEGIDTSFLITKSGCTSGVALIFVDEQGENIIGVAPGANGQLSSEDVIDASEAFDEAKLALIQLEIPMPTVLQAARRAKECGCTVLLNPAPMPKSGLPSELLACVDVLTPNEGELLALVPGSGSVEEAAQKVLEMGPKTIVVTRGSRGAAVFTSEESFEVPALKVEAVDTVGAGDCFSGALGVSLAEGKPLSEAVKFAGTAAGLSTLTPGAQTGLPVREDVDRMLDRR
ncbi:MAG: ribokinase [Armatimonadota bacterium]|nr:ribokinase [bacterium]